LFDQLQSPSLSSPFAQQPRETCAVLPFGHPAQRLRLWKAAIKWPMYSVAVMPVLLAAGWRTGQGLVVQLDQLLLILVAAVLLLAWENLANDVFDADTGVDTHGKPHSVVNLTGQHFRYEVGRHCVTVLTCPIHQGLIPQGEHLTKRCAQWVARREVAVGWCPETG